MRRKIVKLLSEEDIILYDWEKTRLKVRNHFSKYRNYISKIHLIKERYSNSLSNDNFGIFSSNINDPTANKVEQFDKYTSYINEMDKHLNIIKKEMTLDEKIILEKSILNNYNDEELSEALNIIRTHIYLRKKSSYIKVARYFDLEVEKEEDI